VSAASVVVAWRWRQLLSKEWIVLIASVATVDDDMCALQSLLDVAGDANEQVVLGGRLVSPLSWGATQRCQFGLAGLKQPES
jgi:hypothetical protein